jgi:hypothetical protein
VKRRKNRRERKGSLDPSSSIGLFKAGNTLTTASSNRKEK